jgi:hypothetical protein
MSLVASRPIVVIGLLIWKVLPARDPVRNLINPELGELCTALTLYLLLD